jgi:hypothetical protein
MERRFRAALVSAVVLHAALMGLSAWTADGGMRQVPLASKTEDVEVSLLVDGPPSPIVSENSAGEATSAHSEEPTHEKPVAHVSRSFAGSGTLPTEAEARAGSAAASNPDEFADGSGEQAPAAAGQPPRPHIDLGLDGSIVARTLRDTEAHDTVLRSTRRRAGLVFDGWSEGVVSKVAHSRAPSDGSALLTIEWDAQGRLASIRSSAESADANGWRKLAATLKKHLAQRPQASSKGLRLVYLLKSEVVKPGPQSKLPVSSNASMQTFGDAYLPPANLLMLGVKADTSPTGQRVVSVTLANSQVL